MLTKDQAWGPRMTFWSSSWAKSSLGREEICGELQICSKMELETKAGKSILW